MARKKQKTNNFHEYIGTLPMPVVVDEGSLNRLLVVLLFAIAITVGWYAPRILANTEAPTPPGSITIPNVSADELNLQTTAPASYWQPTGASPQQTGPTPQTTSQSTVIQATYPAASLQGN